MSSKISLQEAIKQAIKNDNWDNGTTPEEAAAILRGEAAHLEQKARNKRYG